MKNSVDRAAYWLLKNVNKAIRDYQMIAPGDKVAVAVSGGKDSLSLIKVLDIRRQSIPDPYELIAIHVIGDARGPEETPHAPLVEWLEANRYVHIEVPLHLPDGENIPLDCHRCTWNRRRTLFQAAHELGCNVIAFGHHADDLAQTTLLNILFHGQVETMEPRREFFGGTIRLVRPMCYIPENEIRRFATICEFPAPPSLCPQSNLSQRRFVGDLLRQAERTCKTARVNLLRAGLRSAGRN